MCAAFLSCCPACVGSPPRSLEASESTSFLRVNLKVKCSCLTPLNLEELKNNATLFYDCADRLEGHLKEGGQQSGKVLQNRGARKAKTGCCKAFARSVRPGRGSIHLAKTKTDRVTLLASSLAFTIKHDLFRVGTPHCRSRTFTEERFGLIYNRSEGSRKCGMAK